MDSQGFINQIREKPNDPSSPYSVIGVYLLPPDLPELLNQYLDQGGKASDLGHLMSWLAQEQNCCAWHIPAGSWMDIGNPEFYQQATQVRFKNRCAKRPVNLV